MNDTIRRWTRRELEDAAAIQPEGATMLRLAITPLALLRLLEWAESQCDRIEMLSLYGDPERCEVRFFRK